MRAQTVNFERGQDPKEALGLGIIPSITSDDLEIVSDLYDSEVGLLNYEDWYGRHGEDYENDEEALETYKRLYQMKDINKIVE